MCIPWEQAIRFYTINNAYLLFLERELGSLEVGKRADLIVVDRDLLTCPVDQIPATRVLLTLVEGKVVHRAKDFSWEEPSAERLSPSKP